MTSGGKILSYIFYAGNIKRHFYSSDSNVCNTTNLCGWVMTLNFDFWLWLFWRLQKAQNVISARKTIKKLPKTSSMTLKVIMKFFFLSHLFKIVIQSRLLNFFANLRRAYVANRATALINPVKVRTLQLVLPPSQRATPAKFAFCEWRCTTESRQKFLPDAQLLILVKSKRRKTSASIFRKRCPDWTSVGLWRHLCLPSVASAVPPRIAIRIFHQIWMAGFN